MAISDRIREEIKGNSSSKNNAASSESSLTFVNPRTTTTNSTSSYTRHTPVVSRGQYNSRYGGSYTSKATTTNENRNKATVRYTDKEGNTTVYGNKELKEYQQELRTSRLNSYTRHTPVVSRGTYNSRDSKNSYTQPESSLAATLSQMYKYWGKTNSWEKYMDLFKSDTQNPNSDIYNPYMFNTPSTNAYYAADNEARTQKFEAQWADAKAKAAYWAGRTDLNLSDEDIIERVNLNGYSEIKTLNEYIQEGKTRYYTRELNYSPDILYAVIWEARNDGGSGNELADLIQWQNREGNTYQANDIIQSQLNPADENYNPYSVGATYDDAALYFDVSQFDKDWLDQNRYLLNGSDKDVKMYQNVYSAEQTTLQAEKEAAELKARMVDVFATNMDDPEEIMDVLFGADEFNPRGYTGELTQLGKLDESLKTGKIISTTRPIDYSYNDIKAQVEQHCEDLKTQETTAVVADEISTITGANNVSPVANTQIDEARDAATKAAGNTIRAVGSDAEKIVFQTSVSGFENYMQQITDAVANGTMTEEDAYTAIYDGANKYAAKYYLEMREAEDSRAALLELQEVTTDSGAYLDKMFAEEDATINNIVASYMLAAEYGGDESGGDMLSLLNTMDYLYDNGKNYVPTEWSATTTFDFMLSSGYSNEEVNYAARETLIHKQKEIDEIDAVLAQVKDAGIKGANKYVKNLERKKAAAQQDIQDAQYYLIPYEKTDFKQVVSDYKKAAIEAWQGKEWTYNNWRKEIDGIPFVAYTFSANGKSGEGGIAGKLSEVFDVVYDGDWSRTMKENYSQMTDIEKDEYIYILATEGKTKADEYYKHLNEEVLPVRASGALQEQAQQLASQGVVGAAFATAQSVLMSPAQVAGSIYSIVQAFRGEEINPYHSSFATNMFISSARGAVKEEINEAFGGEDTIGAKICNIAYDALTSSGDSLVSAGLGGGSNVASVLLMGTEAASGAMMDAKMRYGSNAQALLYGGLTLLAESGTEFLPMEKIADAFKGANATKVRQFLGDVLENVFLEGTGESINEIIEGVGDDVIMQELSNRNMAIQQYIADGMTEEEAERQATKDFARDVMYAGITGGVSGSMSMAVSTVAGKLSGGNNANNGTAQQNVEQVANQNVQETAQTAEQTAEQAVQTTEQTATGKPFNRAEAQEIATLMTALESDKAAQAAALSGILQHAGIEMETARAAGQTLVNKVGGSKAILAATQIIRSSSDAGISSSDSLKALANSILSLGDAAAQIGSFSSGRIDADTLRSFVNAGMEAARANESQIQQTVTNNAVANAAREIIGDGALDGVKSYEVAEKQARENLKQARMGYESAQEGVRAAQNNLIDVQKLFLENPSDPKLAGMMQQATGNVEAKTKVLNEYAMSVLKYEGQYDTALKTLKEMRTSAMKTVRQQAVERVSQLRTERAAQYLTAMQQSAETAIPSDSVHDSGLQYYTAMRQNRNATVEAAPVLATETNGAEAAGINTAVNEAAATPVQSQTGNVQSTGFDSTSIAPGSENGVIKSGDTIMQEIAQGLGIPADTRRKTYERSLRGRTLGYQRSGTGAVHVLDAQNINTAAHEWGHVFDEAFNLQNNADIQNMVKTLSEDADRGEWLNQYPAEQKANEVIAEYVKYWMLNRDNAVAFAGEEFTNYFEKSLKEKGWLKTMQQGSIDMRNNISATAAQRANAVIHMDEVKQKKGKYEKGLSGLAFDYLDYTLPWQEVTDTMKKAGKYDASTDVRTLLLANESMVKNLMDSCLYDSLVDPEGNVVDERSFQSILSQVKKKDAHDFNTLWELLNAKTLQGDKKVFSEYIDIDAAIKQLEGKHPDFRTIIDEAESWITNFMQTWLVDTEMIPESTLEHLREYAPYYIPSFRTGDQNQSSTSVSSGKKTNTPNNGLKSRKGSTKDIDNPVMRMVEYMQHYIANYKNVEILRAFDNTMKSYPELNSIAEPVQGDMERFSYHDANQQAKNALNEAIEAIRGQDESAITPQTKDALLDALDAMPEQGFFVKDTATGNDVLNVPLGDGTYSRWVVYNKPLLQALLAQPQSERSKTLQAFGNVARAIMSAAQKATGFLSVNATSRSIPFTVQNFTSDSETAMVTGHTGHNPLTYAKSIIGSGVNLIGNMINDSRGKNVDEVYRLFKIYGKMDSRYSFRNKQTRNSIQKNLYSQSKTVGDIAKKIASAPVVLLEDIADFSENLTRFNEFRNDGTNKATYSGRLEAGKHGREVTVDFSKHGAKQDIALAKTFIPFLNASLQGTYKTIRMFSSENAGNRAKMAGSLVVGVMLPQIVISAIRNATWSDDEKKAYDDLSDEEKNKYEHYKLGDSFLKTKRSQDGMIQAASALGRFLGDVLTGNEDDAFGNLVGSGKAIASNMLCSVDTIADPFVDAANNRTWSGREIDDYNMLELPITQRYDEDTPWFAKALSSIIPFYSPNAWAYIIEQFTGSMGTIGMNSLGLVKNGEFNIGGVRDIIVDHVASRMSVDPVYSNNISGTFYDGKDMLEKNLEAIKNGKNPVDLRRNLTQEEMNTAYEELETLLGKEGAIGSAYAKAKELWKQYNTTSESETLTDAQKDEEMRKIRIQINNTLLEGNAAYGDFMGKYGYDLGVMKTIDTVLETFHSVKPQAHIKDTFEKLSSTFADDYDNGADYMQKSYSMWESIQNNDSYSQTKKDNVLPHTNKSFDQSGVTYEISDEEWGDWEQAYRDAYQNYVDTKSVHWDTMTEEDKIKLLSDAHSAGHNAAKKWYWQTHERSSTTNK